MGMEVKITTAAGFGVQVAAARRRAIVKGGAVILAHARANAPRETGEMVANSRVALDVSPEGEGAAIVFEEDYSAFQELGEHYHHPQGGGPHFLEGALLHGHTEAFEVIAAEIRAALGGGR